MINVLSFLKASFESLPTSGLFGIGLAGLAIASFYTIKKISSNE